MSNNVDNNTAATKVVRFEVIDHRNEDEFCRPRGRVFTANPCKIELSYQDDGETLKVFVEDSKGVAMYNPCKICGIFLHAHDLCDLRKCHTEKLRREEQEALERRLREERERLIETLRKD